jgi:hypothetical protein
MAFMLAAALPLSVSSTEISTPAPGKGGDELSAPMEAARIELSSRRSWAKDIPKVVDVRRKGVTLIIGIGTPIPQDMMNWKTWWEQAICTMPELKEILRHNGAVNIYSGAEPVPGEGVSFNRGSCGDRSPDLFTSTPITATSIVPRVDAKSYKVVKSKPSSPTSDKEDPMGMASTFTTLNESIVEFQLQTAENPYTAMRIALFKKNLFSALMKRGFSRAEAVSIVNSTPIPTLWH